MTVEPHAAYTVCIRPVMPAGVRTLADYQASIIARFGKLPSWAELARRENRAMLRSVGNPRRQGSLSDESRAKMAAAKAEKGGFTVETILAALVAPMTREDIARKTGIPPSTAHLALRRAHDAGLVGRTSVHRHVIWHRVQVAAE